MRAIIAAAFAARQAPLAWADGAEREVFFSRHALLSGDEIIHAHSGPLAAAAAIARHAYHAYYWLFDASSLATTADAEPQRNSLSEQHRSRAGLPGNGVAGTQTFNARIIYGRCSSAFRLQDAQSICALDSRSGACDARYDSRLGDREQTVSADRRYSARHAAWRADE